MKRWKEIIELTNAILLPDKINETLYSQAEKIKKLSKEIILKGIN